MEVLSLEIKRKGIGEQPVQRFGNVTHGRFWKIGRGIEGVEVLAGVVGTGLTHRKSPELGKGTKGPRVVRNMRKRTADAAVPFHRDGVIFRREGRPRAGDDRCNG
jgi:hypothetical protein